MTVLVGFAGVGGAGPLAWGQAECWRAMVATGSSLAMGAVFAFPAGATVAQLAEDVRFWMERYDSMRTRLRLGPDGEVTQVVAERGEVPLQVVDAGGRDPAAVAEDLLAGWKATRFDYEREWPVRLAVVERDGRPSHAVVAVCHLAADGAALAVMVRERAERPGPYGAPQPLELAARQRTPAGERLTAASLRHWGTQLRSIPPRRFPDRGPGPGPRYRRLVWDSPALHLAARRASTRTGADTGAVVLAAFAIGLGSVTGTDPLVVRTMVGNRFRPGLADVVSPLTQSGLCVLAVAGLSPDEAVGRAVRASLAASKNAYYDPDALAALQAAVQAERGEEVELGVLYNDRRMGGGDGGPVPVEQDVRDALGRTAVLAEVPMQYFNEQLMVNVEDVPGTVRITAELDTHVLPLPDLRAALAAMEAAVTAAAVTAG